MVIDLRGAVDYALLEFGGCAGLGDKYFAYLGALQRDQTNKAFGDVTKRS